MGAWGYNLLDNDEALDDVVYFMHLTGHADASDGAKKKSFFGYDVSKYRVNKALKQLTARAEQRRGFTWVVLAALIMHTGARMSAVVRSNALQWITEQRFQGGEGWNEPKRRDRALQKAFHDIEHYESGVAKAMRPYPTRPAASPTASPAATPAAPAPEPWIPAVRKRAAAAKLAAKRTSA